MAEDGGDVCVLDASGERDLAEKAPDDAGIVSRTNRLQGQTFARFDIAYGVHDAHASPAGDVFNDEPRPLGYMNPLILGTGGS